jgi:signal transduction histidine kinase
VDGVVRAIVEHSNGDLWIGTWGGGLSRWVHQTGDVHNYSSPNLAAYLSVLYEDSKGTVWIGTNAMDGLVKWDRNSDSFLKDSLERKFTSKNWAASILEDSYGTLWVGTGNGICVYDRNTKTKHWYALERSGSSVSVIFEDHLRKLWISAAGSLYEYDRVRDQFVRRQDVRAYSIFEDEKNRLWLGFNGGLVLYDQKSDSILPVLTEGNGLAGGIVFGILGDALGNLWLSTNKGLTKYNPDSHVLRNYGTHDGYPFPQISFGSYHGYYKKRNGEMMFGAGNGYVEFHPDSIRDNPNVPPIVITDFRLFNEPVRIGHNSPLQTNITDATSLNLTYNQNTISFEFAALDFTSPLNNKFAHKLEGFDDKWVDIGNRHFAQYTNLSPGEYVFRVKGTNSDGVWNEQGASVAIIITPPWWKTKLAYACYGIFFISVLYSVRQFEKRRDRQKQQAELERVEAEKRLQQEFSKQLIETQEAERKRVASELHDSLGQHLLIVNNELQLYRQSENRKDEDIDRTITTVKGAIKEVREIASNLHPHHLEKLGLRAAVEAMIEQISRSAPVKFNAVIADVDNKLSMQAKINLYRVLQEAIANIVRHSGATKANITIREADNAVQATIEDDGKGFVQGSSPGGRQGFGLKSMTERMNLIGGTITFESSPDKGTTIRILIPIHN